MSRMQKEATPQCSPLTTELRVSVVSAIADVRAADWDACANPNSQLAKELDQDSQYNPFISHDFLGAMEESHSVGNRTGWQAQHLVARTPDGTLVAAAPCYLKSHSHGEYVFDRGWAEAYERAGGSYYPKLQVAVPFTPATARRPLPAPGIETAMAESLLAQGLVELCRLRDASSVHVTFLTESELPALNGRGFLTRTDQQFHWQNAGFD